MRASKSTSYASPDNIYRHRQAYHCIEKQRTIKLDKVHPTILPKKEVVLQETTIISKTEFDLEKGIIAMEKGMIAMENKSASLEALIVEMRAVINDKYASPSPKKYVKSKVKIPPTLKDQVWLVNIGNVAKTRCLCCGLVDIQMTSFSVGHVVSEANGGATVLDN